MSAGEFTRSRYQATYDTANIHPIRVQPETISLSTTGQNSRTNAAPTGSINVPISAKVSKGNREIGLRPRYLVLEAVSDTPSGYEIGSITRVPILTEATFNAINEGDSVSYNSGTWEVVSKIVEDVG